MQKVSHPIQNVDSPTHSVRLPMHKVSHPRHHVSRPIHFIAIRLGFCAFAELECPVMGQSVPKRDRVVSLALRATSLAARGCPPRSPARCRSSRGSNPPQTFCDSSRLHATPEGNVPRRGEGDEGFFSGLPTPSLPLLPSPASREIPSVPVPHSALGWSRAHTMKPRIPSTYDFSVRCDICLQRSTSRHCSKNFNVGLGTKRATGRPA